MNPQSNGTSDNLPDLGTLWEHPRYGLILLTKITHGGLENPYCDPVYRFYVFMLQKQHHTWGLFSTQDWYNQFTLQ
jgi:hypothetical protein